MPAIKTNPDQQKALNEVSQKLEILADISKVNAGDIETVSIQISRGGRGRKGAKIALAATDKEVQKVMSAVTDYKRRLVREIKEKAKKFDIGFSDEELELLDGKTMNEPSTEPTDAEPLLPEIVDPDESSLSATEQEDAASDSEEDAAYFDARRRFESDM